MGFGVALMVFKTAATVGFGTVTFAGGVCGFGGGVCTRTFAGGVGFGGIGVFGNDGVITGGFEGAEAGLEVGIFAAAAAA